MKIKGLRVCLGIIAAPQRKGPENGHFGASVRSSEKAVSNNLSNKIPLIVCGSSRKINDFQTIFTVFLFLSLIFGPWPHPLQGCENLTLNTLIKCQGLPIKGNNGVRSRYVGLDKTGLFLLYLVYRKPLFFGVLSGFAAADPRRRGKNIHGFSRFLSGPAGAVFPCCFRAKSSLNHRYK